MTDSTAPPAKAGDEKRGFSLFWTSMVAMVVIAAGLIAGAAWALGHPPLDLEQMGQNGDFFGGVLNPLLTFLTFLALLYTLVLQRKELKESRTQFERSADALSEQNSQTAFYQALTIHNDLVGALQVTDPVTQETARGRDAFRVIYSEIRKLYRQKQGKLPKGGEDKAIVHAFGVVLRNHPELAHYFRYLFNTIVLVERFPKAPQYIKLLRSLLSNHELLLLYYNAAVSPPGKAFTELAVRHELFDNMPAHLLDNAHAELLPKAVFGPGGYEGKLAMRAPDFKGDLTEAGPPRPTKAPRTVKAPSKPAASPAKAKQAPVAEPVEKDDAPARRKGR